MPNSFKAFTHQQQYQHNPLAAAANSMHRKMTIRAMDEQGRRRAGFPGLAGVGGLGSDGDEFGFNSMPDWVQQDFTGTPIGAGDTLFTDITNWWDTSGPSTWFEGCSGGVCSGSGTGSAGMIGGGGSGGSGGGGGINWSSIFAPLAQFGAAFGASQTGMVAIRGANGQVTYVPANSPLALSSGTVGLPAWVYVGGIGLLAYMLMKK